MPLSLPSRTTARTRVRTPARTRRVGVLAVAAALSVSLLGAGVADAHYLDRHDTQRLAKRVARSYAGGIDGAEYYGVKPCRLRTPHRASCRFGYRGHDVETGDPFTCEGNVLVKFASHSSYRLRARAIGVHCDN